MNTYIGTHADMQKVYGQDMVDEISNNLSLPSWWIESVLVEYFDCRRYALDGEVVVGADDLDVKYTVYNGKKLLRKKIFNFLEHEIEADDIVRLG